MGQMRNPQFPGNRFAAPRWSRLGFRQRGCAPTSSHHALWARAIAAKFAGGKSSSTWQPAAMIHARMAGVGNVLLRMFLTQNFLTQNLESQTWLSVQAGGTQWGRTLPAAQPAEKQVVRLSGEWRRISVEPRTSPVERRTDKPEPGRIQFLSPSRDRNVFALLRADGDLQRSVPISSRMPIAMTLAARLSNIRPAESLPLAESSEPELPRPGGMALHITNRHRRVEEHGFRYRRELAIDEPRSSAGDMSVVAGRAASRRVQEPDIRMETDSSKGTSRPKPVVDTARITDEVLKQLDRRLIAARERMGKI